MMPISICPLTLSRMPVSQLRRHTIHHQAPYSYVILLLHCDVTPVPLRRSKCDWAVLVVGPIIAISQYGSILMRAMIVQIDGSSNIRSYIDQVKAATGGQEIAARQPSETKPADSSPTLRTGYDNILSLGRLALGNSQVNSWESKGLEVTNETLEVAYEALNRAFKASIDSPHSAGIAINAHQIVADHQPVPEWFLEEKEAYLEGNDIPGAKEAFARGEYFHVSVTDSASSRGLKAYSETQMGA